MMKRTLLCLLMIVAASGCVRVHSLVDRVAHGENPYLEDPFWARYLSPSASDLDWQISQRLEALRQNPASPRLHNELGMLLVRKGFPSDAIVEFRRAIALDRSFYTAWYNLGIAQDVEGNSAAALRAFRRTIAIRPGHSEAHFQIGLLLEKMGRRDDAIDHFAKAYMINPRLLEVRYNPRAVETELTALALLKLYPEKQSRKSAIFHRAPAGYDVPPPPPPAETAPAPNQ